MQLLSQIKRVLRGGSSTHTSSKAQNEAKTRKSIIESFVAEPSLANAYQGRGGELYTLSQKEGPYRLSTMQEFELIDQAKPYINKNILSLGPGDNELAEVSMYLTKVREFILMGSTVTPRLVYNSLKGLGLLNLEQQLNALYIAFACMPFIFGFVLKELGYIGKSYKGVDNNGVGLLKVNKRLSRIPSGCVETYEEDFFKFLNKYNNTTVRKKTITMIGGTYGNFKGEGKEKLIELMSEKMNPRDNILITYFPIPQGGSEEKNHLSLYDNDYQRNRTLYFLNTIGFETKNIDLRYVYNETTRSIENYLDIKKDISIGTRLYKQGESVLIHSSDRMSANQIQEDFGPGFEVEYNTTSNDNLNGIIILKKT